MSTSRNAIADHLSEDLPYKLSPEDVFLTSGCTQAIEIVVSVLSRPGANILLPRPGFPFYEARCAFSGLEVRHFNLVPEREWEIDLNMVEALADGNTAAMVVINPCNPCGSVFSYQHLAKVAETAQNLGIVIIADEVYDHLVFGKKPFVPMGAFGQITPILTLGFISKRWGVPGWRLGWIATSDPKHILKETKVVQCIKSFLDISTDPATFVQGAVTAIIKNTNGDFFNKIIEALRKSSELCCEKLQEIDCVRCPSKPEGSMSLLVELNLSSLDGIQDDFEFCCKLAKEESVIVLPGTAVGLKNWLRVSFAVELSSLDDALDRLKSFCRRHRKKTH
ncbi:hypothetical protein HPP92_003495 [Vanilla planifolia]|uniref:nicotianamine aminotransferase n=1 Tax=Vanilla planifolia TaxID=51239 RepID=A0A835VNI8_VANPL|nr:hypothetical protein HPP92_003495 [Vanilla planifolia]